MVSGKNCLYPPVSCARVKAQDVSAVKYITNKLAQLFLYQAMFKAHSRAINRLPVVAAGGQH